MNTDNPELPLETPANEDDAAARARIDGMDYKEMLRMVRCAPLGDPLFIGDTGKYFHLQMKTKRSALTHEQRVAISKAIGF